MTRSKTFMGLIIALALVFSLPMTANGGVTLEEKGDGIAVWSTDKVINGDYSAKLTIPIEADWSDAARVKVSYGELFSTIANANLKYWYFYDGVPHNSFVRLDIDADGNGIRDHCLISLKQDATVYNGIWTETIQTDSWQDYTVDEGTQVGTATGTWKTIAEWQAETATFPPLTTMVTYLLVMMGPTTVPSAQTDIMYIDDITIDGVTYAVEPGTPFKLVWTTQPEDTKEAGVDITTGKVSVQAADPDSGLIDITGISVTVKAYRSDNDNLSTGYWDDQSIPNSVGINESSSIGVATFGGKSEFDFSKTGTFYFVASSGTMSPGNSDDVTISENTTASEWQLSLTTPTSMGVNTQSTNNCSSVLRDKYGNVVTTEKDVTFERVYGTNGYFVETMPLTTSLTGYVEASYHAGTDVSTGDSVRVELDDDPTVQTTNFIELIAGALTSIEISPRNYGITYPEERVVVDSLSPYFAVELQDYWGNQIDAEDIASKRLTVEVSGPSTSPHGSTAPELFGVADTTRWRFQYIAGDTVDALDNEDSIYVYLTAMPSASDEVYARVIGGPVDSLVISGNVVADSHVVACADSSNTITFNVEALDQYGNPTENRVIDLEVSGSVGGHIAGPDQDSDTTAVGVWYGAPPYGAFDGVRSYLAGSKAQEITLTVTGKVSGVSATEDIALEAVPDVDSIFISSPYNIIMAGQTVTLTFNYFDSLGNQMNINTDPDTTFANLHTETGHFVDDSLVVDTLDIDWPTIYGVRLKKDYKGDDTLTATRIDTIIATADAGAVIDSFFMTVTPPGAIAHFALEAVPESLFVPDYVNDTVVTTAYDTVVITAENAADLRLYTWSNPDIVILELSGSAADPSQITWLIMGDPTHYHGFKAMIPESTFVEGVCTVYVANEKAETDSVIASIPGGVSGTSNPITWLPIDLYSFGVVAQEDSIFTLIPFSFTVIPYDTFMNVTPEDLPDWIEFIANEPDVSLPGPQKLKETTVYSATAANPSTSLIITVRLDANYDIIGASDPIIVILWTGIPEDEALPIVYSLKAPDLGSKTIQYAVPERAPVSISLFDKLGRRVGVLVDKTHDPGYYEVHLDRVRIPSGIYFIKMESPSFNSTKKMLLLK